MSKPFTIISGLLFLLAAAAHAYRLYTGGIAIMVAGHAIPLWASWPASVFALVIGLMLFVEARK